MKSISKIIAIFTLIYRSKSNVHFLSDGWWACSSGVWNITDYFALETSTRLKSLQDSCLVAKVPGTILNALISGESFGFTDPYYAENLINIPDLASIGNSFYSYWFINIFDNPPTMAGKEDVLLLLGGVNYMFEALINGHPLPTPVPGMFSRHTYLITNSIINHGSNILAIRVHPPPYCGKVNGGQGGDHEIARNGAIMQCTAGWDWIQGTPDRNTGIWRDVSVIEVDSMYLHSPLVVTVSLSGVDGQSASLARLNVTVVARNLKSTVIEGSLVVTLFRTYSTDDDSDVLHFRRPVHIREGHQSALTLPDIEIPDAALWWPHTYGEPHLYQVEIYMDITPGPNGRAAGRSNTLRFPIGLRTVEMKFDEKLQGPKVFVNGVPVFLIGGNWIATDQLLRYSGADWLSRARAYDEVRLHRHMGLNAIRVWGGGIAESDVFYEACDELGVLVMQEVGDL